jgi:hypothetical protein
MRSSRRESQAAGCRLLVLEALLTLNENAS